MGRRYEIQRCGGDRFVFCLIAATGHTLLIGRAHSSKANVMRDIEAVRTCAGDKSLYALFNDDVGRFRFALQSARNLPLGQSQSYDRGEARAADIATVQRIAAAAETIDLTV